MAFQSVNLIITDIELCRKSLLVCLGNVHLVSGGGLGCRRCGEQTPVGVSVHITVFSLRGGCQCPLQTPGSSHSSSRCLCTRRHLQSRCLCTRRHLHFSIKSPGVSMSCVFACLISSVVSDALQPRGLQPARLLCPWESPGKNTGVGCRFLLQGVFPTQGSNPCL